MSEIPSRGRPVRLRDVAEAAGVDTSVVSRVVSGDPALSIRVETRRRILDAVAQLDYRPNVAARSLKTARTMALALVVPELQNVVYSSIAAGAEERAAAAGYVLFVVTGTSAQRVGALRGRVDGLLVAAATSGDVPLGERRRHLPWVLVNRHDRTAAPAVVVDDAGGAATAVRHLVALGHRRIAHVAGPQDVDTGRRRLAGYRRALAEASLPFEPALVREAGYTEEGGLVAAEHVLRATPPPTAIFAANVLAAIGVLAAARRTGFRVPDDLSVVGFHDARLAPFLDPPLTTVRMPLCELGREAVDVLLGMIAGEPARDVVVQTPPELVVRGTAAPPPRPVRGAAGRTRC